VLTVIAREIKLIMRSDSTIERANSIAMTTTATSTATTAGGYEAIPLQLLAASATPDSGAAVHIAVGDHHTIEDVVVLENVSRNSSRVTARLKRYVWRTLLALVSIITAITVLVGQTILGASLTNTDNMIGNVKAEVQSMMLASNGGGGANRNNSSST
jgi:hypothetical protein